MMLQQMSNKLIDLDRDRFVEWTNMCVVLTDNIAERSEITIEQRATKEGDH